MDNIKILINNKEYVYEKGTTLFDISKDFSDFYDYPIMGAFVGNKLHDLTSVINHDCNVEFFDCTTKEGSRIYQNGLTFILIYAIKELYGMDKDIKVCHSIDKGRRIKTNFRLTNKRINDIKKKMDEIISNNILFDKCLVKRTDACKYFKEVNDLTKVEALRYLNASYLYLYRLGDLYDCFYSILPMSTGFVSSYDIMFLNSENLLLQFPSTYLKVIPQYHNNANIMEAYNEYYKYAKKLNIFCASDLNKALVDSRIQTIIKLNEINLNDRLLELAKNIYDRKDKLKIVLIAGPSSSGKTTTARKLSMFLQSFGLNPKPMSIDDYFIEREKTPKLPNGQYDYESLKAVNVELFNEHLIKLLNYEEVHIPTFNFVKGIGEYTGNILKLEENDILIIEGLHALNEELTKSISLENKYKVYVSPLTDLNIDDHNMISTSDVRCLRRMIRDYRTRGYSPEQTLKTFGTVREGEEKYIFPFQGQADFVYNTAFIYEIGVLKLYAEPLLYSIEPDSSCYEEARRLIDFLSMFLAVPTDAIPDDSLLKEFIGDSYFE